MNLPPSFLSLTSHVGEAAEQEGEEEVEDDEVADEDGGEEVRHAGGSGDVDAVPHGLDPLPAEDPEDNHETVHEVGKIPPRHFFPWETVHIILKKKERK